MLRAYACPFVFATGCSQKRGPFSQHAHSHFIPALRSHSSSALLCWTKVHFHPHVHSFYRYPNKKVRSHLCNCLSAIATKNLRIFAPKPYKGFNDTAYEVHARGCYFSRSQLLASSCYQRRQFFLARSVLVSYHYSPC